MKTSGPGWACLLLMVLLSTTGCGPPVYETLPDGQWRPATPERGDLVVVRRRGFADEAVAQVDLRRPSGANATVARLQPGDFARVPLSPGPVTVSVAVGGARAARTVEVHGGERVLVELSGPMRGATAPEARLEVLEGSAAQWALATADPGAMSDGHGVLKPTDGAVVERWRRSTDHLLLEVGLGVMAMEKVDLPEEIAQGAGICLDGALGAWVTADLALLAVGRNCGGLDAVEAEAYGLHARSFLWHGLFVEAGVSTRRYELDTSLGAALGALPVAIVCGAFGGDCSPRSDEISVYESHDAGPVALLGWESHGRWFTFTAAGGLYVPVANWGARVESDLGPVAQAPEHRPTAGIFRTAVGLSF